MEPPFSNLRVPGPGARQLAELFHDRYEKLAPEFGWMTRMETRTFDPNSTNGRLMIAVCDEILTWLDLRVTADELARLKAAVNAAIERLECTNADTDHYCPNCDNSLWPVRKVLLDARDG